MTPHPFDLERAVASWKQFALNRHPYMSSDQREELEQHVRDAFEDHLREGLDEWTAFSAARKSVGDLDRMESSYRDNHFRSVLEGGSLLPELAARWRLGENYVRAAFRTARKRPLPTFVNVVGLSTGLACCLLIGLFVWHQGTFDRFHRDADNIYRIGTDYRIDGDVIQTAETVGPLLPVLMESIPEIEEGVRLSMGGAELKHGQIQIETRSLLFADSTFFKVFDFPLVRGNEDSALLDPLGVILTTPVATRLFGDADPVGQSILVDDGVEVRVTGVLAPLPERGHLQFDVLANTEALRMMEGWIFENWWSFYFHSYVRLADEADPAAIQDRMTEVTRLRAEADLIQRDPGYALALEPLDDIYLHSQRVGQIGLTGNPEMLRLFGIIGLLILLIALANFVNLATGLSLGRAREIGIRKVVGGSPSQLSRQFMWESFAMVSMAGLLSLVFARVLLEPVGTLTGVPISIESVEGWAILGWFVVLTLFTTFLAGWYPAWLLSRIPAASVLSGTLPGFSTKSRFRQISVVLQFTVSFILIATTLIVQQQLDLLETYDNGFDRDGLITLDFSRDDRMTSNPLLLRERVAGVPGIQSATLSSALPGDEALGDWNMDFETSEGTITRVSFPHLLIDERFLDTYRIPLLAGRDFRDDVGSDRISALILNQAATRQLGFEDPADAIGIQYDAYPDGGVVIGVVADFHFSSLRTPVGGIAMRYMEDRFGHLTVRGSASNIAALLPQLQVVWSELNDDQAFNARLLDDILVAQYGQDQRFGQFFRFAAAIAIVIAIMGLFAQITISLRMRSREIGVRRVLGAHTTGLALLLSREVIVLTSIACALGIPVSWVLMTAWLEGFTVHGAPQALTFLVAGCSIVGIAFSAIIGLTVRAARMNPVHVLRSD